MNTHLLTAISALLFILMTSCDSPIHIEADKIISNNEIIISQDEKLSLEKAQKHFAEKRAETLKHPTEDVPYYSLKSEDINKLSFTKLPYYCLDTSFIAQDSDTVNSSDKRHSLIHWKTA